MSNPPAKPDAAERLWEIDALRGAAVVGMIVYHTMWDLAASGVYTGSLLTLGWHLFQRAVASTFIFLVGFNMTLAETRRPGGVPGRRWLERGLKVLGWGMVVSLVTWPIFGPQFIAYGILHFIGTALLLAPMLLRCRRYALPAATAFLLADQLLERYHVDTVLLIPLGLQPSVYATVDYFPLVPWLGVVLLGIWAGPKYLAARGRLPPGFGATPWWARPAVFLGRNSLLIYLIHQPIIIAVLMLLGVGFF